MRQSSFRSFNGHEGKGNMINAPDGYLHIYMLNVGQADTTLLVTPNGTVILIDAVNPDKVIQFMTDLGLDGTIEHLIITHPHDDHFSGCNRLAQVYQVKEATVSPIWHEFGMGPATYRSLMARLVDQGANINFLAGYNRWYPENALTTPAGEEDPQIDPDAPFLELLGPSNGLVSRLETAKVFETNHLSIMTRFTWKDFRMICAGDAQMENWSCFDDESLMEGKCQILRASHHGSPNGTQWERLERLSPCLVVVSSDPASTHKLPDLSSAAVFLKFDDEPDQMATITVDTGTIHVKVDSAGKRTVECFGDSSSGTVQLTPAIALDELSNPTDWAGLLNERIASR